MKRWLKRNWGRKRRYAQAMAKRRSRVFAATIGELLYEIHQMPRGPEREREHMEAMRLWDLGIRAGL